MIQLWIALGTVEWCVIGFIIAMAVVAAVIRPQPRHAATTYFIKGTYDETSSGFIGEAAISDNDGGAHLEVHVGDSGPMFSRRGFDGLLRTDGSSIALAITIKGMDITIKERLVGGQGLPYQGPVSFDLSGLHLRGNYHIQYISEDMSRSTAFSLLIRPGIRVKRSLRQ
ncbi:MAG: hypothetical protein NC127_07245 [Muribaculum sp.]|nr:hypothetical protein [Muribaculum sp.]